MSARYITVEAWPPRKDAPAADSHAPANTPLSAAPISEPQITRTIVLAHAGRPAPTTAVRSVVDVLRTVVEAAATGSWPSARRV